MNCEICAMWNDMDGNQILRKARFVGQWGDGKTLLLCAGCKASGAGRGNGNPIPIDDYQETVMANRGVSLVKLTKPAVPQPTEAVLELRRLRNQASLGLSKNDTQALRTAIALSAAA
ncbi:hypothetical protein ACFYVL_33415 [Streptomyces sp. NPDC004111]|uniref:hypothetical protein n=1 Tax=Streptomyces sp. NPDC004111 TaxID=3364690 RepID=UPI0036821884